MSIDRAIDPSLVEWVEATLGGTLTATSRTPSGGSRGTWFVTATGPAGDAAVHAVLRIEAGGSFTGTDVNVANEAAVYRALEATPVPVPRVLGATPDGSAVLLERLAGSADLGDTGEMQQETLAHFVDVIADLHNVDADALELPGFPRPRTPEDHATLDLDRWRRLAERTGDVLDPLVRYAGSWLLAHPPSTVARTCLIQGDTGPGNFVAEGGRVTGLIDMEFAHLGDPMDDIAWMMQRGFRRRGIDAEPYLARYTERSGIEIDEASLAYYGLAVEYRCAVTTTLAVARGGGARGLAPYLLVTERYVQATAAALSKLTGVDEPPVALAEVAASPRTALFDDLLEGIRQGVRGIADPELREETRNRQILVHHLRAHDLLGAEIEELDRRDAATVGLPDGGPELDRAAEAGGATGDESVLRYLLRRTSRHRALWASLLDRPPR